MLNRAFCEPKSSYEYLFSQSWSAKKGFLVHPARARAVYWQTEPPQWGGKNFFCASAGFFFLQKRPHIGKQCEEGA